jgi:hypothetical protein
MSTRRGSHAQSPDDLRLSPAAPPSHRWRVAAVLVTIGLAGAALRLQNLDQATIGHAEMYVPGIHVPPELANPRPRFSVYDIFIGMLLDAEPHPPGYYLMMLPWTSTFGDGPIALRFPSVAFGVASIFLIYVLGLLDRDRWTGLLAAALLAVHGLHIFWSQTAKMYEMGVFFGLLSSVLLLMLLHARGRSWLLQAGYVMVTVIGLSATHFVWPLLIGQCVWTLLHGLVRGGALSPLLRLQLLALILGSPFLSMALFQSRRESYLPPNPLEGIVQFLELGFVLDPQVWSMLPAWAAVTAGSLVLCLGVFLLALGFLGGRPQPQAGRLAASRRWTILIVAAGTLAVLGILRFARFTQGMDDPQHTRLVVASAIVPVLCVGVALFLPRAQRTIDRLAGRFRWKNAAAPRIGMVSLTTTLAILPAGLVAAANPVAPLFESRTILVFTPYLLIVIASGLMGLIKQNRAWLVLAPALIPVFVVSVASHQEVRYGPTDYKSLAERWMPNIREDDVIFVQHHWATTPIFYYLSWTLSILRGEGEGIGKAVELGPRDLHQVR